MFISLGLLVIAFAYASGECAAGCNEPTLMYENLQCTPIYSAPTDCCPSSFDCKGMEERATEEKCYFKGKAYAINEDVNNDDIYGNCKVGCVCRKKNSGNMGFTCAILDCPEWLGYYPEPGCYLKYELDKCCNAGTICKSTIQCEVNGKTYNEGQTFDAPNLKCTKCVCEKGFAGKFEAPFCKKKSCIEEVTNYAEVSKFCAPSYISKDDCCPLTWQCPTGDEVIVASGNTSDKKCKFGKKLLDVGDKFEKTSGEKGKLSCECVIPPFLTCTQNYDYPWPAPEY